MDYPKLTPIATERRTVDVFGGYNRNLRIGSGEFCNMENLTSELYPVLSPRKGRSRYASPASPQGIIAKEQLCYVDGAGFVIGDRRYDMALSVQPEDCPKQLVSMGAYVIILPDKKYINTVDPEDRGNMDASYISSGTVTLTLCREDGTALTPAYTQSDAPESPENGALWLDTSLSPGSLKQWSEASSAWVSVASTYVRIHAEGIGAAFGVYDGVTISGMPEAAAAFNTSAVIRARGEDYLVINGLLNAELKVNNAVTVARKSPRLDFVTESGNRLWGCRFGVDDSGEIVNRIYASKLGDFKNWNCFMGVSTDSYYVNLGSDGPFTGAVTHMGCPLFFKENSLHKLYGSVPADFTLQDTACRGVQPGCDRSLAIVGEVLYYKSRSGVCAYDGSLPWEISQPLGSANYDSAVAGAHGSKYYISMAGEAGWELFVYDTARNMWHREDDFHAGGFASLGGVLYAIDARRNELVILSGAADSSETVRWLAETGELCLSSPEMKYVSRITLRLSMEPGSVMEVLAQYDQSDAWEPLCSIRGTSLRSFSIPVRPRRSDFLRLRFQGSGGMKLYAMTKTVEKGSELSG